jgi:hypothetical protein
VPLASGHFLRCFPSAGSALEPAAGSFFLLSIVSVLSYEHNLSEPVIVEILRLALQD